MPNNRAEILLLAGSIKYAYLCEEETKDFHSRFYFISGCPLQQILSVSTQTLLPQKHRSYEL